MAGQPAMGSGCEPASLNGDLLPPPECCTPGRLPGEPIGGWTLKSEPQVCDHCPDISAAPTFLWGVPPGQSQNTGQLLDPHG